MKSRKVVPADVSRSTIDWNIVHERLNAIQARLDSGFEPSPDEVRTLLKKRAASLSREAGVTEKSGESISLVEFLLADERYGIETAFIREVYPLRDLTPLPGIPAFIMGIINVRGQILSIIDIKKFFGLPVKDLTDLNKVIIVRKDKMELGILADAIIGAHEIPIESMQPSISTLTGIRAEYLRGVTQERLIVLDIERILNDPDIIVNENSYKGGA